MKSEILNRSTVRRRRSVDGSFGGVAIQQPPRSHFSIQHRLSKFRRERVIERLQKFGGNLWPGGASEDFDFWRHCSTISGSGYRDRINGQNRQWFEDAHAGQAETRVMEVVGQKWNDAITTVRNLLSQE